MPRAHKGFLSRKERVQQFNEFIELLGSTGLEVLKLLGSGNTASQAAKVIGCVRSNITYWKNKLVRLGLLKLQTHDVVKIYGLTLLGSKVLTGSEGGLVEVVVLEDHAVKFRLVEGERRRVDWVKLGSPRNWVKLGVRVGGVRVVKTSRSVIVHPGRLRGWDPDELLVDAGRVVERVKGVLEGRFGMVLGDVGFPLHKPVFRFYSDEAGWLADGGTTIVHDAGSGCRLGSIDCSPPERVPHEEYDGKELAKERLLMPLVMRRLERKVDALSDNVLRLVSSVDEVVEAFKRLIEPQQPVTEHDMDRKVDYVA